MKKLVLCLGMCAALLTSCSNDDDNGVNVSESRLMKKWYPTAYVIDGETIPYPNLECGMDYIELMEDGVVHDVEVISCEPTDTDMEMYTWSLDGDDITLNYGAGEVYTAQVTKLTSTELHIKGSGDIDGDGTDETIIEKYSTSGM